MSKAEKDALRVFAMDNLVEALSEAYDNHVGNIPEEEAEIIFAHKLKVEFTETSTSAKYKKVK